MRRTVMTRFMTTPTHRHCEANCDYPSDCRWGKQYGVPATSPPTPQLIGPPPTSFEQILGLDVDMSDAGDQDAGSREELNEFFKALVEEGRDEGPLPGAGNSVRSAFDNDEEDCTF